jgi:NAD+ synthetase
MNESEKFNKIAEGNIKARVRMIHLYDLAYRTHGMVLGTDNLTEKLVGFWTIAGDIGDWGLIQNLWKTEVYDLSRWMCIYDVSKPSSDYLMSCVNAVPTDGLGISNSDLDQLGAANYDEVDKILKTWLIDDIDSFSWDDAFFYPGRLENYEEFSKYRESLKDHPVVQRHIKTEFKRLVPINLSRNQIFKFEENPEL